MVKIVHAQTVLAEDDLIALKEKTGEKHTKDAIAKAIEHYLHCSYTDDDPLKAKLERVVKKRSNKQQR
ncbi:MAG: DUF5371 family protein [Methermicoccaceae archaeon]